MNTFVSSFSAFCLWKKLRFVTFWKPQSYEKREKKLADRISWIREVINIQHVLSASKFYVQLLSLSLFNNVSAWQLNFNLKFFSHSCSCLLTCREPQCERSRILSCGLEPEGRRLCLVINNVGKERSVPHGWTQVSEDYRTKRSERQEAQGNDSTH